jgi:hypothetical protein
VKNTITCIWLEILILLNKRWQWQTIDFVCLMVFNATFNNISVISCLQFYWWRKSEDPKKTTNLSQVTDKLYHIMLYFSPWSRFELTTSVVRGTHRIGDFKSNYNILIFDNAALTSYGNVCFIFCNAFAEKEHKCY